MSESIVATATAESTPTTETTQESPVIAGNSGESEVSSEAQGSSDESSTTPGESRTEVTPATPAAQETPVATTKYQQYQELLARVNDDPNYKPTDEEFDLISDVRNGKVTPEEAKEATELQEGTDEAKTDGQAAEDALDVEIKEIMDLMGVEDFAELPKTLKTTLEQKKSELEAANAKVMEFSQREKQLEPLFQNMEELAVGLFNGDAVARARMAKILEQRGIDPKAVKPLEGAAAEINPDDFLDPEAYKAVTDKISKLEGSVQEYLLQKQEEKRVAEEQAAQEQARTTTVNEFASLVEKFPSFGLKPHQVREGIEAFFKTGQMPATLAPLIELVNYTDKLNDERGYHMRLEDAYKLREFEKMPQRIAEEVKKAKTALVKQRVNPTLATAQNRSQQGLGGTVHTNTALVEMTKSGNYPDEWKTGGMLNYTLIPAADLQALQTIWSAKRRG